MQLKTGSLLQNGKYEIVRTIGQGGFGITYEAIQVALNRRVAIKEFFMKDYCEREESSSYVTLGTSSGSKGLVEKFRVKFIREAQMIAGQENPHIVKIYDVFEENGTAYYVMEFLEGGALSDLVKKSGPLSEDVAIGYILQVGDALSLLHSQNFLHFDVKPSNILLNRFNEAVLIDFGVSKHYDETGNQTSSTPVGLSKGYAPLEQYQQVELSSFTPATDIYALGATLFYLLTGQTPPSASEVNEDGLPSLPENISQHTKEAINRAMAPRRKDRPQSIQAFLKLLKTENVVLPIVEQTTDNSEETIINKGVPLQETGSVKAKKTQTTISKRKRHKIWIVVAPLLLAIAAIVGLLIASNKSLITKSQGNSSLGGQPSGITQVEVDSVSYMIGYSCGQQLTQSGMKSLGLIYSKVIKGFNDAYDGVEVEYDYFEKQMSSIADKCNKNITPSGSEINTASYLIGYSLGMQAQSMGPLNTDMIVDGISAARAGVEIDYNHFQKIVNDFAEKRSLLLGEEMTIRSQEFFDKNIKKNGVKMTTSGLQYKIIREGGTLKPRSIDTVVVNYQGSNLDGKVFDSSYDRNETASFPLTSVIQGWTEGLQYVGEGGEIMLWIPADLAYGEKGAGADIRPNEALTFRIELISIKKAH